MRDGHPTPPRHDGMAVIASDGNTVVLVRNHEDGTSDGAFGPRHLVYDPQAAGGTTTLRFNTRTGTWLDSWISLSGTSTNCAGGATPWGSWLTCEETVAGIGELGNVASTQQLAKDHGWVFEVPAVGTANPTPLPALGRFMHEAVAVDSATGIVYATEDRETAGFYRCVPHVPGQLRHGGRLQMLTVVGVPQLDLSDGLPSGAVFAVTWVDIPHPEWAHTPGTHDGLGVYRQGLEQGGATFRRLEGCKYDNGLVYFTSTSGGAARQGQVWAYDPRRSRLRLLYESPSAQVLANPDNLTVSPGGVLLLCEDSIGVVSRLLGLTAAGTIFSVASNNIVLDNVKGLSGDFRQAEWAGATFSPDGRWLFVNIQTPGITFAITGPWEQALL